MGGACSTGRGVGGGEAYTGFWWGNLREKGPGVDRSSGSGIWWGMD